MIQALDIEAMARKYVRLLGSDRCVSLAYINEIKQSYGADFAQAVSDVAVRLIINSNY